MRLVLAFSGDLASCAAVHWLREQHAAEVAALTLDLGQGGLEATRDRALALGAHRAHVIDVRDEFAQTMLLPALRADALHANAVPMAGALARPLIARKLVEIAGIERADAVAHSARMEPGRQSGSSLERLITDLAPSQHQIAPRREWPFSEADLIPYLRHAGAHTLPIESAVADANIWGRSPRASQESPFRDLTPRTADASPDEPALVDISFTHGVPTALNHVPMSFVELIASLGMLAAMHGVGVVRSDGVACEAPAAVVLHAAHRALTRATTAREMDHFSDVATRAYVGIVETGRWFSSLRPALDAYFDTAQMPVTGSVRLRLHKGAAGILSTELATAAAPAAQRLR